MAGVGDARPTLGQSSTTIPLHLGSTAAAGTNYSMGSLTRACVTSAPIMSPALDTAARRAGIGRMRLASNSSPVTSFKVPTMKKATSGKPLTANSCC